MAQVFMKPLLHLQHLDLAGLNIQQLTILKQQVDQEIAIFTDSLQTLKIAQGRFQESGACLEKITPNVGGKEILVPLTSSMYVTGKLSDANNVLVDIGTGYYAEKSIEDAKDYFKRRVDYVTEQMEKIRQIALEKNKLRETATELIEVKIQAQMQKELSERA